MSKVEHTERMVTVPAALLEQVKADYASAHAELMKAQGADPDKFSWPDWSPQANTLRWMNRLVAEPVASSHEALVEALEQIAAHEPSERHSGNLNDLIAHASVKTARAALSAQSAAYVGEDAGADRSGGHLSELLDRVNAATGPDRYIDALIHLHHRPELATAVYSQPSIGRWVRMDGRPDIVVAPAYSESMDAVVDLLKQSIPWVLWATGSMEEGPFCRLVVPQADGGYIGGYVTCNAESPPLAILAALLTALIRKQQ